MRAALAAGVAALVTGAGPLFSFADPEIDESSGLVEAGGLVLTVNDSGSGPVVYAVDPATGETAGRTTYSTGEVVDVEALAAGPDGSLWVGDIGDNRASRSSVAVYALPPVTAGDRTVTARRYDLVYRGGPRDAEALLVHPETGRLFVVSKGLFGGQVFAAPERLDPDRPNQLVPVGETDGLVTDGAFLPDGRHAVLRTYSSAGLYDADDWSSPAAMRLPAQRQGEGLAVRAGGRDLLLSSEGSGSAVLVVPLSADLRQAAYPRSPQAGPAPAGQDRPVGVGLADRVQGRDGVIRVVTLSVVVLAAALTVRAVFRSGPRRSRSKR